MDKLIAEQMLDDNLEPLLAIARDVTRLTGRVDLSQQIAHQVAKVREAGMAIIVEIR